MSEASSTVQADCQQALVDVRKAFRLLLLFQRRIRALCQEISTYINYTPYWTESPMGHSMDPEFVFTPTMRRMYLPAGSSNEASNGSQMLELVIKADSMFEDFANRNNVSDPANAASGIIFRVYKNISINPRNWLGISRTYHNAFSIQDKIQVSSDGTVESYSKWFNFCDLCDQPSIRASVDLFRSEVQSILSIHL